MASESCCPPGSWPGLVEDTAHALAGTTATFPSGLDYYYTAPPAPSTKGIIVAYDVHGFNGGRVKSVCDSIAAAGFHVIMPGSLRHCAYQQAASCQVLAQRTCTGAKVYIVLPQLCISPPSFPSSSACLLPSSLPILARCSCRRVRRRRRHRRRGRLHVSWRQSAP